jgi:hypothetical protein
MADVDRAFSRTRKCCKDTSIVPGISSNPFDTSFNNIGAPALFGVFLEVAGG